MTIEEWLSGPDQTEFEAVFGRADEQETRRVHPPCPDCETDENVVVDYGEVSWPDEWIHPEIHEGMTPFACLTCGRAWNGNWPREEIL